MGIALLGKVVTAKADPTTAREANVFMISSNSVGGASFLLAQRRGHDTGRQVVIKT